MCHCSARLGRIRLTGGAEESMAKRPQMNAFQTAAALVMQRCAELGAVSEEEGPLTRTFASTAMKMANDLVGGWMKAAGLAVHVDAAFNLLGRWTRGRRGARTLLLGSH